MNIKEQRERLSEVWRRAADFLSVRMEAPYAIENENGDLIPCVAYLPDFGGPKGMVIGFTYAPKYEVDTALRLAAEKKGLFYTFINLAVYESYREEVFKEALNDWGFFGDQALRPSWMIPQA